MRFVKLFSSTLFDTNFFLVLKYLALFFRKCYYKISNNKFTLKNLYSAKEEREEIFMEEKVFDFYDSTSLKSYNLDKAIRYQLNLLDTLDVFTRKHSENVANITCRLCEYLHCRKGFIVYCTTCAYLHDIGKLFVPSDILQKPGTLTPEERAIIQKHTLHGYNLCMKDLQLRPYATVALNHHEALNGSGYPNGLTLKEIPLEAQIVSVADQFDALVSKRQYKSHIDISEALKLIIEETKPIKKFSSDVHENVGRLNRFVVKKLLKVVLDDIYLEISFTQDYVEELKRELSRLKQIEKYKEKMNSAKKEKERNYYLEGIKVLLKSDETLENYDSVYKEYEDAYIMRKSMIDKLYDEIKIIKKLRV